MFRTKKTHTKKSCQISERLIKYNISKCIILHGPTCNKSCMLPCLMVYIHQKATLDEKSIRRPIHNIIFITHVNKMHEPAV